MGLLDRLYQVDENVQLRPEKFGLLLYDRRGPSLFFLGTRELIPPELFLGQRSPREVMEKVLHKTVGLNANVLETKFTKLIETLKEKGLIREQ